MAKSSTSGQKKTTQSLTSIEQEKPHLKILSKHKHFYDFYMASQEIVNFSHEIQNEILEAFKVEHPHYHYQRTCPVCVSNFLVTVYRWYNEQITK